MAERTPDDIASKELAELRHAVETLPTKVRGNFARLCAIVLLLDMAPADRALTLGLLRTNYFPQERPHGRR